MKDKKRNICFFLGGLEDAGSAFSVLQLLNGIDRGYFNIKIALCEDGPYAARLRARGLNCDILGTGWPPALRRNAETEVRMCWRGFLKMPVWFIRSVLALVRYVRDNSIDIIHTNYHHFHIIAALAAKMNNCKCIWHWRVIVRCKKLKLISGVVRRLTSSFAWSIANSLVTAASVRPYTGDRLTVVYNGVEIPEDETVCNRLRELLGLSARSSIVGLVGSLSPIKGHSTFLEAARQICSEYNDVHFVYIGGQSAAGQQEYFEQLQAKRQVFALEHKVHFLGNRSDAFELTAGFDIATVCTLPPGEGFGMVIVEAMAHSVPVISTSEGAALEIITDGETGILIPACNSTALADAIRVLLNDDKKRKLIGLQGHKMCKKRFDIKRTVEQVQDIYRRVLHLDCVKDVFPRVYR